MTQDWQVILFHCKICHGYSVSFPVTRSFKAKNVPVLMVKGVHSTSKIFSSYTPARALPALTHVQELCSVAISQTRCFAAKHAHSPLERSSVPTSRFSCNAQYIFPKGSRVQQKYHSTRGKFECLLHLSSLDVKAFSSPCRAQLTHNCNAAYSEL